MTLLLLGALAIVLTYVGRPLLAWLLCGICYLGLWALELRHWQIPLGPGYWSGVAAFATTTMLVSVPALRRRCITRRVAPWIVRRLPALSASERALLDVTSDEPAESGASDLERRLVSGRPDWQALLDFYIHEPDDHERALLRGPVQRLCGAAHEWETYCAGDLSADVWHQVGEGGLLGLRVPAAVGGRELSAAAAGAVIARLASRSPALGWTVAQVLPFVELVQRFGTPQQQNHYLARVARGEAVPCTLAPEGSGESMGHGVIQRGVYAGRETIGIRLDWEGRSGALAPLATVLAASVPLFDPEQLLGGGTVLGLTWVLVPAQVEGLQHGERHESVLRGYAEGPIHARGAFIPLDFVIGGTALIGAGEILWSEASSLVEAVGVPAFVSGSAQLGLRLVRSEHLLRHVGDGEPVWSEPLARSAGRAYALRATRRMVAGTIDAGQSVAGVGGLLEERALTTWKGVIDSALEVGAASASRRGPGNPLSSYGDALPLGAARSGKARTERLRDAYVRTLVVHEPHLRALIRAHEAEDLAALDRALASSFRQICTNVVRTVALALTRGRVVLPPIDGQLGRCFGRFSHLAAATALAGEAQRWTGSPDAASSAPIQARLSDVLGWLFVGSANLKAFHDAGQPESQRPIARWAAEEALYRAQESLRGVLDNLEQRWLGRLLRLVALPPSARLQPPSDRLARLAARTLVEADPGRTKLSEDLYEPNPAEPGLGRLESAANQQHAARTIEQLLVAAAQDGRIAWEPEATLIERAVKVGLLKRHQQEAYDAARGARRAALMHDSFPGGELASAG